MSNEEVPQMTGGIIEVRTATNSIKSEGSEGEYRSASARLQNAKADLLEYQLACCKRGVRIARMTPPGQSGQ